MWILTLNWNMAIQKRPSFFYFSKKFDWLDHRLMLIEKLKIPGITGKESQWFDSYLSNRIQLVEITHKENHNVKSKAQPITIEEYRRNLNLPLNLSSASC